MKHHDFAIVAPYFAGHPTFRWHPTSDVL